jgi:DnaJ-class molecular chaperone
MANAGSPGNELRATLALNPQEAYHGTERTLTLPGGRRVTLPIPPRATSGQEIRLAGQGDPLPGGGSGDLIITLAITTAQAARKSAEGDDPNAATIISSNFNNGLPMTQRAVPANPAPLSQPSLHATTTPDYQSPSPSMQTPQFQIPYYQSTPPQQPQRK